MGVTKLDIKKQFKTAESDLNFCWNVLVDIKTFKKDENDFGNRFILFQERLASLIFRLQSIRDKIIIEEKSYVKNKGKYNIDWFKSKLKLLGNFKKGIDHVVNISKSLGDAYAFFFYQSDLKLLSEHLSHEKVVNNTAGSGERGELEFVKQIKQVEGHFTLFHGITNILRYGDFSFINLASMKVAHLGELKTSVIDENNFTLKLFLVDRTTLEEKTVEVKSTKVKTERKERQLLGIINFFINNNHPNSTRVELKNDTYCDQIELLLLKSRINKYNSVNVSKGLAFVCLKYKKSSLYNRIFKTAKTVKDRLEENNQKIIDTAMSLMKSDAHNSLIIGQLLYDRDFSSQDLKGVIPLFWEPINNNLLKSIYFSNCMVTSIFNPIHLIEDVEDMGYVVESEHLKNSDRNKPGRNKHLGHFDSFIPYIVTNLFTEEFVLASIIESENYSTENNMDYVEIKLQQHLRPLN